MRKTTTTFSNNVPERWLWYLEWVCPVKRPTLGMTSESSVLTARVKIMRGIRKPRGGKHPTPRQKVLYQG